MNTSRLARAFTAILVGAVAVAGTVMGAAPAAAAGFTVSGTVSLGSAGAPAGAREVRVYWTTVQTTLVNYVETDANGDYAITGLPATGSYHLYYQYVGSGAYGSVFLGGTPAGVPATPLPIASTDHPDTSPVLPAPGVLTGTVRLGAAGTAAGVGEVSVTRQRWTSGGVYLTDGSPVTTAADGTYSMASVLPGVYRIRFQYQGSGQYQDRYFTGASYPSGATPVVFGGSGDTAPRDINLLDAQTISGTVGLGSVSNPATANAVKVVASYTPAGGGSGTRTAYTDASGRYELSGLPISGSYSLVFTYQLGGLPTYAPGSSGVSTGTSPLTTADIVLEQRSTIAGSVTLGGAAAGAGDVRVTATPVSLNAFQGSAVTTAGGAFAISGLAPGTYQLTADYLGSASFSTPVSAGQMTVPGDVSGVVIDLPATAMVSGTVRSSTGTGIPGATVTLEAFDDLGNMVGSYSAVTSAGGEYSVRSVASGYYVATFAKAGYATQTWDGASVYYEPDVFEVGPAEWVTGVDATLPLGASISGSVAGAWTGMSDIGSSTVSVEVLVFDAASGSWFATGDRRAITGTSTYLVDGLAPDEYRLRFVYRGVGGVAASTTPTITLGEGEARDHAITITAPAAPLPAGTLVKSPSSPIVYLVDGKTRLIPLSSFATAVDAGIGTSFQTVEQSRLDAYTIAAEPLTNVLRCGPSQYALRLASGGQLIDVSFYLAGGWDVTQLELDTCLALPRSTAAEIDEVMYIGSAGGQVYRVDDDGVARPVSGLVNTGALVMSRYQVRTVTAGVASSFPLGARIALPGTLLKTTTSPTVYLSDGDHLVRISSMATISDLGLPSTIVTVGPSFLDSYALDEQPLVNALECEGFSAIGAEGLRQSVTPELLAGLVTSSLYRDTCHAMPFVRGGPNFYSPPLISTALFLKSPAAPTIYYINSAGQKQAVLTMQQLTQLSAPIAARYLTVNDSYLAGIPEGASLLLPGQLFKTAAAPTVYLADGGGGAIPLRSFESVAEMGLSTAYSTVSPATLAGLTVASAPLSNAIACGATRYLASGGRLWPIDPLVIGVTATTTLPAGLCASLTKATTTADPLFVKSPSADTVYLVEAGIKRPVLVYSTLVRMASPSAPTILTVNAPYLATLSTGREVIDAGMLVKSASAPTVYLATDASHLVPIPTFDVITEMGLPTSYSTVPAAAISARTVATAALSNAVSCGSTTYLASAGRLWPVAGGALGASAVTVLPSELCGLLAKQMGTSTPLFVKTPSAPTVYLIEAGSRRTVVAYSTIVRMAAPAAPTILTLNAVYLATLASGSDVLDAGSLVKSAGSPTVYLVTDATHLVPVRSFASVVDLGLATSYVTVPASTIATMTVSTSPLSNAVACAGTTYLAHEGRISPTGTGVFGSTAVTDLPADLCAVLPKSTTALPTPVVVKSPSAVTLYAVEDGVKRPISTWATVVSISGGGYVTVDAAYLATLPTGAVMP